MTVAIIDSHTLLYLTTMFRDRWRYVFRTQTSTVKLTIFKRIKVDAIKHPNLEIC
jgi:hypothetical protein